MKYKPRGSIKKPRSGTLQKKMSNFITAQIEYISTFYKNSFLSHRERRMRKSIISLAIYLITSGICIAETNQTSLYNRLGGKDAIIKVVDDFVSNVSKDSRINKYFKDTDINHLKSQLVDQLCEATGGPCKYEGQNMKNAHAGLGIKSNQFEAMVEDLKITFRKFKIPDAEQNSLLAILGPMKKDIVEE